MNSQSCKPTIDRSNADRPPIRERLRVRTRELALRAGRIPPHVAQLDYEQAKRELTGKSELDEQAAVIASMEDVAQKPPLPLANIAQVP